MFMFGFVLLCFVLILSLPVTRKQKDSTYTDVAIDAKTSPITDRQLHIITTIRDENRLLSAPATGPES